MSVGRRRGDALDRYDTPPEVTRAFLKRWRPRAKIQRILEPGAGAGAMIEPLFDRFPRAQIDALDIEPRSIGIGEADYLGDRDELRRDFQYPYDLVFTNPPYLHAVEFASRSFEMLRHNGLLVLLLRVNFLESERRAGWLRHHMPEAVYVLRSRPSFYKSAKGASSDASAYAWFVWRNHPAALRARSFTGHLL